VVVSSGCAPDAPRVIARVARYDIDDVMRAAVAAYPDPALSFCGAWAPIPTRGGNFAKPRGC